MPIEGNQPSQSEKTSISMRPSQYEGVEAASSESTMTKPSQNRLWETAAAIPAAIPVTVARSVPPTAIASVHREPLEDLERHRVARSHRDTEVALERSGEETPVLQDERLVESEVATNLLDDFGPRFEPGEQERRVARDHVDHQEDEDRGAEKREEGLEEAFRRVAEHASYSPSAKYACSNVTSPRGEVVRSRTFFRAATT